MALDSEVEFKNEISVLLQETTGLSPDMHGTHLRIFKGHIVITLRCDKALYISSRLMKLAKEKGVKYDPVQTLYITIFRSIGEDMKRMVEKTLYNFRFDSILGSCEAVELFDIAQKKTIWWISKVM